MIAVAKSELKAKMLEYFRRVEQTGEEIVVTDHRKSVLRVSPIKARLTVAEVFADLRGKVRYGGDLTAPDTADWGV